MIFKNKVAIVWDDIIRTLDSDDRLVPFPLTVEVLNRVPDSLEMHDGIITATAMLLHDATDDDVAVITRDRDIRTSGLVDTVW